MSELSLTQVRELLDAVYSGGMAVARAVNEGFSSAMKRVIHALKESVGFINHHDEYWDTHGDDDFRPLPPVWIVGEEGVGKRTLAQRLHEGCVHRERFLDVDCRKAADSEYLAPLLFGDGPHGSQCASLGSQGKFWDADGGILVIREPSMLPASVWDRLAEWQRTGEMRRKWPHGEIGEADVVLTFMVTELAASRDSCLPVGDDLRYSALRYIRIPPLRDRPEDVVLHLEHFLRTTGIRYRGTEFTLTENFEDTALLALVHHSWPDNLLGVRRVVEFMVLTDILKHSHDRVTGDQVRTALQSSLAPPCPRAIEQVRKLSRAHGRARGRPRYPGKEAMENFEQQTIQQGWSQLEAARALGVADSTLCRWRQKAGLLGLPLGRPLRNRLTLP